MDTELLYREIMGIQNVELCKWLEEKTERLHLDRGEYLIRQGQAQTVIPFLMKGVIRGFYLAEDGSEITDCLITQKGYPVVGGVDYTRPSPVYLDALTDCDLLTIPVGEVTDMLERNPEAMLFYNRILKEAFNQYWQTQNKMIRGTAMERYMWFLETYPGLIDQISNRYVASFLGMTTVTLSRLRSELRKQNEKE